MYVLRKSSNLLSQITDVNEGLENRIKNAAYKTTNYQDMLQQIKTKRYTFTRLQRILINALLGITKKDMYEFQQSGGPQYARILAFSSKGAQLLKILKPKTHIPLITNIKKQFPAEEPARKMLHFDI